MLQRLRTPFLALLGLATFALLPALAACGGDPAEASPVPRGMAVAVQEVTDSTVVATGTWSGDADVWLWSVTGGANGEVTSPPVSVEVARADTATTRELCVRGANERAGNRGAAGPERCASFPVPAAPIPVPAAPDSLQVEVDSTTSTAQLPPIPTGLSEVTHVASASTDDSAAFRVSWDCMENTETFHWWTAHHDGTHEHGDRLPACHPAVQDRVEVTIRMPWAEDTVTSAAVARLAASMAGPRPDGQPRRIRCNLEPEIACRVR